MSGEPTSYIWDKMPYAQGLQYEAIWWQEEDKRRQLAAFDRVPRIHVLATSSDDGQAGGFIV